MGKKQTTYEEAKIVFETRGLILDVTENEFNRINLQNTKLKCHCFKHPLIQLEYYFTVVKSGRFGCKECRKESSVKSRNMTIEEKMGLINDRGYTYVDGDMKKILNPLRLICPNGHECSASINDMLRNECVCNVCNGKFPAHYWTVSTCQEWLDNSNEFSGYKVLEIDGL